MSAEHLAQLQNLLETEDFQSIMDQADPIANELGNLLKSKEKSEKENSEAEDEEADDASSADAEVNADEVQTDDAAETEVAAEQGDEAADDASDAIAEVNAEEVQTDEAAETEVTAEQSSEEEPASEVAEPDEESDSEDGLSAEESEEFYRLIKEVVDAYRTKKSAFYKAKKEAEEKNLDTKKALLEEMQQLIQGEENIGRAYNRISELHEEWKNIGDVPRAKYPEIQVAYSRLNEQFYYNISMYKELREHDFKRNSQLKLDIIEKLTAVAALDSIREMEKQIKKLQAEWEAIGPTRQEEWEEIKEKYWSKVKVIYAKIREHYDDRRSKQTEHLEVKKELLAKVITLVETVPDNHKAWEAQTKSLLALQTEWKGVGYAGKSESEEVWKLFRENCDDFFNRKKAFYNDRRSEFDGFTEKKRALVEKAEALKESTDWINTSKALIQLQKEWKKIGNAGPRHEHKLWKGFRSACDHFFEARKNKDAEKELEFVKNQEVKEALIKTIEAYKAGDDVKQTVADLKAFSADFNKAGHVPSAAKDGIYKAYKAALDKHYDGLDMDANEKEKMLFEARVEQMKGSPQSDKLLDQEAFKIRRKINDLKEEILQFENNLGFFANSKGAEKIIADVQKKIDKNRALIDGLKVKLKALN